MRKEKKIILPILPDHVSFVRDVLTSNGVLKWRENSVNDKRIDFVLNIDRGAEGKLLSEIPFDFYAIRAIQL